MGQPSWLRRRKKRQRKDTTGQRQEFNDAQKCVAEENAAERPAKKRRRRGLSSSKREHRDRLAEWDLVVEQEYQCFFAADVENVRRAHLEETKRLAHELMQEPTHEIEDSTLQALDCASKTLKVDKCEKHADCGNIFGG